MIRFSLIVVGFLLTSLILAQALSQTTSLADVGILGVRPGGLSAWASTAPMIDGLLRPSYAVLGWSCPAEWADAYKVDFVLAWGAEVHDASLYVMNDYVNLYLAFEMKFEKYDFTDHVWVNFDNDNDDEKDVGDNVLYLDAHSAHVETFAGRFEDAFWNTEEEGYPSSDALEGGTDDGVGACKFTGATLFSGNYTFEFAFPLNTSDNNHDFSLEVGDTVGFNILYMDAGGGPDSEAGWPTFTRVNWNEMATVRIAGPPLPPPPSQVNLKIDKIEITQAIQWLNDAGYEDNSVPLARGKSTVVRVYLNDRLWSVRNVEVYLYATISGWSRVLPGVYGDNGPLRVVFDAPPLPDRANADDTANFLLPDYWVKDSHVTLKAFLKAPLGQGETDHADNWMGEQSFSFKYTYSMRVGYYLIDYRPSAPDENPYVPSMEKVSTKHQFFERIAPIPDLSDPVDYFCMGTVPWDGAHFLDESNHLDGDAVTACWDMLHDMYERLSEEDRPDSLGGWYPDADHLGWGRSGVFLLCEDQPTETLAHEICHTLGRKHPWQDLDWPPDYTANKTQTYGFTPYALDTGYLDLPPFSTLHPSSGDIMSFDHPHWISPYTWEALVEALDPPPDLPSSPSSELGGSSPGLLVSGGIYKNNTGRLNPVFQTPYFVNQTFPSGPYVVEFRGAPPAEPLLYSQSFDVSFSIDCIDPQQHIELDRASFLLNLPFLTGPYSVSLWNNSISPPVLLDKITASAAPPQVTITYPNGGETVANAFTVNWTASDSDGNPLTYKLSYSTDNGASWKPLSPCIDGTSYFVNASMLPGGSQWLIRVQASDGFYTSEDQSDTVFTVPRKTPLDVVGFGVSLCSRYDFGNPLLLKGSAFDPEDGVLQDSAFTWVSNLSGVLGTGRAFTTTDLRPGNHAITLIATDSDGNNISYSFHVTVELHDIAVADFNPNKKIIGEGYGFSINYTLENLGLSGETYNATLVANKINVNFPSVQLFGSATEGWGFNPSSMTNPGPTITVNQWDHVNMLLFSADSLKHNFFIDYDGDESPGTGEPKSSDFTSTTTYQFVADIRGAFTYYCQYHSSIMSGAFVVQEPIELLYYQEAIESEGYLESASQRKSVRSLSSPSLIKGYYNIGLYAGPVPKEFKTADNLYAYGIIRIGIPGDVNGDAVVDSTDLGILGAAWGSFKSDLTYNANADIDDDEVIDSTDLGIMGVHWGETE